MTDFVQRMKQIKGALDAAAESGVDDEGVLHEQEQMLDELQEIVESVDHARGAWQLKAVMNKKSCNCTLDLS